MRPAPVALSLAVASVDAYPHPDLAPPSTWPGVMIIIILIGFIATAMVLGPVVRAIMEDEDEQDIEPEVRSQRSDLKSHKSGSESPANGNHPSANPIKDRDNRNDPARAKQKEFQ